LAWALRHAGRADEGLAAVRRAATIQPDDPRTRTELGDELTVAGDVDAARAEFEWVVEQAEIRPPTDTFSRAMVAWAQLNLGRHEDAATNLATALADATKLDLDPEVKLFDLGLNWLLAGHIQDGEDSYDEAFNLLDHALSADSTSGADGVPERALSSRGPLAVAIHDLETFLAVGRLDRTPEVTRVLAELREGLRQRPLPADIAAPVPS
jgi:tetratricopeptide (TPR) repeat protein